MQSEFILWLPAVSFAMISNTISDMAMVGNTISDMAKGGIWW